MIGSDRDEAWAELDEVPRHQVHLSPYEISRTVITVGQWKMFLASSGYAWGRHHEADAAEQERWDRFVQLMRKTASPLVRGVDPDEMLDLVSQVSPTDDHPIVFVSWFDCVAFTRWLSVQSGQTYSLPTEAQWERACRGEKGACGPWEEHQLDWEEELERYQRLRDLSEPDHRFRVNLPAASPHLRVSGGGCVGIWDNIAEWCLDRYSDNWYETLPPISYDPAGTAEGVYRSFRGGCSIEKHAMRCGSRGHNLPQFRNWDLGFRIVRNNGRL